MALITADPAETMYRPGYAGLLELAELVAISWRRFSAGSPGRRSAISAKC